MIARIYRPKRVATQSGQARAKAWRLDYVPSSAAEIEPLMGWTGSNDTTGQVKLAFDSCEEAVAFARKHGLDYHVDAPPPEHERRGLSYSDNFKAGRVGQWTH